MFRLLPITVTMLSLLLVVKVNEVYIGSQKLKELYSVRDAVAEDKPAEKALDAAKEVAKTAEGAAKDAAHAAATTNDAAAAAKEAVEKPAVPSPVEAVKEPAKAAEGEKKPAESAAVKEGEKAPEKEAAKEGEHGEGEAKPPEEPKTFGTGKSTVKEIEAMKARDAQPRFTKTEIDLLESLSKRRDELDARERDLQLKSKVLEATEKRIGDKMNEMKTLQADLSKVLAQYNEKQDAQLKSLVKIYESMKPDEAAAIFNEMEMPILLDVIGKMSERKVAPVLANMSPKKAKDVTQELAEKRRKTSVNASAAAPMTQAPAAGGAQ